MSKFIRSAFSGAIRKNISVYDRKYFSQIKAIVELIFDVFVKRYVYTEKHTVFSRLAQDFFVEFEKAVLDITKYLFDQDKGYAIIKEGNIEVFVYQLEKLNDLVPELSAWIGVPFEHLEKGNQASDKWFAESYRQAQQEIEFSQEYFDKCYNEPYVKYCYNEADIERFKARWRPHIKKEL
ncbi:MAG: putative capsular polysaccharide synthesis family protein [Faecalibacterium sp.]